MLQDRPLFFDPKREKRIVVFFYGRGEIANHNSDSVWRTREFFITNYLD